MANVLKGTVWIIDTASADPVRGTSASPLSSRTLVSAISWSGYSDAAHTAVIEDANGIIHTFNGDTDLTPQIWAPSCPVWLRDIKVTTLGSGKVAVAVE